MTLISKIKGKNKAMKSENEMLMNIISNIGKGLIVSSSKIKQDSKRDSKKKWKTNKTSNNQTVKHPVSKATLDIVSKSIATAGNRKITKNQNDTNKNKIIKKTAEIKTNNGKDREKDVVKAASKVNVQNDNNKPLNIQDKKQTKNHLERENILSFRPTQNK